MVAFSGFRQFFIPIALCLLLIGCAGKSTSDSDQLAKFTPDEEELMEFYTPRDDGRPLTPDELHAFKTIGDLDRELTVEESNIVELHFKSYVHDNRKTMQRIIDRSGRFLPYIEKIFSQRGMPADLFAVAMAESGGNPLAYSRAGAAGLWQFMPYTGRKFGLTQNSWIDERRDPFKATGAAADYLLKLYGDFNDWPIAIAAYNAGEGKMGRAIKASGGKTFFEVCELGDTMDRKTRLRQETTDYVPRIIAFTKIMRNLERLGFQKPRPESVYNLAPINIPPGTNLSAFARSLNLTWDEFSSMNPAYRRTASPPNMETTAYILPEQMSIALNWLSEPESRQYADWRDYTVRRGDTLGRIAKRHGVSQSAIREANGFTNLPKSGAVILIPGRGKGDPVMPARVDKSVPGGRSTGKYVVKPGDTLFSLAQAWGTDVNSIRLANRMGKSSSLRIGERLSVPNNSKRVPKQVNTTPRDLGKRNVGGESSVYTVRSGDTLSGIARDTGVSAQNICRINGIQSNSVLKVGQKLSLMEGAAPAKGKASSAQKSQAKTSSAKTSSKAGSSDSSGKMVTVKSGDTLFSIARNNRTSVDKLRKRNNLGTKSTIRPGQKLYLP